MDAAVCVCGVTHTACLQGVRGLPGLTGDPGPAGLDGSKVSHNK